MALLATLPMPERAAVEAGLAYPEESAGRLMQRDFVAVPEFWTVGQTIDYLRANPDLPDDFYDLYIINPRFEPVGSIPLSKVLRSKRGVLLTELGLKALHLVPVEHGSGEGRLHVPPVRPRLGAGGRRQRPDARRDHGRRRRRRDRRGGPGGHPEARRRAGDRSVSAAAARRHAPVSLADDQSGHRRFWHRW